MAREAAIQIRATLLMLACAGLLAVVAASDLSRLERALHRRQASARAFGSKANIELLNRLDALRLGAAPEPSWAIPDLPPQGTKYLPPTVCPPVLYTPTAAAPESLPSSVLAPAEAVASGLPVLSLAIETCRLQRLLERPGAHGRRFEEPAFLSYYEGSQLRFSSGVGLRLHGKSSRRTPYKSYRLHFRSLYGEDRFLPGILSPAGLEGPRQVVVSYDTERDFRGRRWHFISALAYDISRRVGAFAPHTQPALVFLNGEPRGLFLLTERIDDEFLGRRLADADFEMHRGDIDLRGNSPLTREALTLVESSEPLDMSVIEQDVDLDNLTRWWVATVYCANEDAFQGAIARPRGGDDRRWFWILWDMDLSFYLPGNRGYQSWLKNPLRGLMEKPSRQKKLSAELLRRLLRESAEYRRYFTAAMLRALNHQLTTEFLDERVAHYARQLDAFEVSDRRFMRQLRRYVAERPAILRRQMQDELGAGQVVRLTINHGERLLVDGFPITDHWQGHYFSGMTTFLQVREPQRASFSHWLVDGRRLEGPELEIELSHDLTIEAIFTA